MSRPGTQARARVVALAMLLAPALLQAQASQGRPGTYFIRGGTVVTMTGQRLANANLLIRDGKIAEVGSGVQAPAGATVIDASGKFVYPGLIDSHTDLGISEIGSVPASQDVQELGAFNPHMRALIAVNPSSELIAVTRANGVTAAITAPAGGLISGQAALIGLDGWTQEEMAVRPSAAFVINYPRAAPAGGRGGFGGGQPPDPAEAEQRAQRQVAELRDYLARGRDYDRARAAGSTAVDVALEALRPLYNGSVPALVLADTKDQLEGAFKLADDFGIRTIIGGGDEAYKVAAELARRNVPVILGSLRSVPPPDAPYDAVFANPGVLHRAGVKFAFSTGDGSNARHLPYHAALAVAFGLPSEVALQALTVWPAQIWGVSDRVGTIEAGKSADLFIASGDPLDIRTQVYDVFVEGKLMPKDDRHTRLYEKYRARPRR